MLLVNVTLLMRVVGMSVDDASEAFDEAD